eukprot:5601564-Amphidinium_carterae.1
MQSLGLYGYHNSVTYGHSHVTGSCRGVGGKVLREERSDAQRSALQRRCFSRRAQQCPQSCCARLSHIREGSCTKSVSTKGFKQAKQKRNNCGGIPMYLLLAMCFQVQSFGHAWPATWSGVVGRDRIWSNNNIGDGQN